jgi:DNA-binding CsgD family transcriptional regulator
MAMRKNISALRRKGKSASEIAELLDINLAEVEAYIQQDNSKPL